MGITQDVKRYIDGHNTIPDLWLNLVHIGMSMGDSWEHTMGGIEAAVFVCHNQGTVGDALFVYESLYQQYAVMLQSSRGIFGNRDLKKKTEELGEILDVLNGAIHGRYRYYGLSASRR